MANFNDIKGIDVKYGLTASTIGSATDGINAGYFSAVNIAAASNAFPYAQSITGSASASVLGVIDLNIDSDAKARDAIATIVDRLNKVGILTTTE